MHFRLGSVNNTGWVNILIIGASAETMHKNEDEDDNEGFQTPPMEEILEENQTADEL